MASWEDLRADPAKTALLMDFDGTLSPIVVDPAAARPVAGAADLLRELSRRYGCVALVSGRPVHFLVEHVPGVRCYGLYGLEWATGEGEVSQHEDAVRWRGVIADAATTAEAAMPIGVGVERKGLTVAFHVRPAPEHDDWVRRFAEAEADVRGLQLDRGRLSYELRPPIDVNKGTVVGNLLDGVTTAGFVGDDRGDLLAFDALDRFTADGGTAVKAAVRSDESPPELLERADVILDSPTGVLAALRQL